MAFALVGAAGTASVGASGANVTPVWGAGANRTAGNLLVAALSVTGANTNPSAPSGWTKDASSIGGSSVSASVYHRIATGGDAAPTFLGVTGGILAVHLEEWSGNDTTSNVRWANGNTFGTTSPVTATISLADTAVGQLVVMAGADFRSAARAPNDTWTSNHGTPTLRASNNGVSSTDHYSHATLVANSNSGADTAIMTASVTTSITGLAAAASSYLLAPAAAASVPYSSPYPQVLPQ